jgi:hypothetical protein
MTDFFKGRKLAVATKHEKGKVIIPLMEKELAVVCVVSKNINTDRLGPFLVKLKERMTP